MCVVFIRRVFAVFSQFVNSQVYKKNSHIKVVVMDSFFCCKIQMPKMVPSLENVDINIMTSVTVVAMTGPII